MTLARQMTVKEIAALVVERRGTTALRLAHDGTVTVTIGGEIVATGLDLEELRASIPKRKD
jgi:hypothetical protein